MALFISFLLLLCFISNITVVAFVQHRSRTSSVYSKEVQKGSSRSCRIINGRGNVYINMCIDQKRTLSDNSASKNRDKGAPEEWRQINAHILPVELDPKTLKRPELITFDAMNTLIEPSQSIGRWYREALNDACDMRIRLPRPALFTAAFDKAFRDMSKSHPCFGQTAASSGMTSKQWWYIVIRSTLVNTENNSLLSPEEIDSLMPQIFETLYSEVFSTTKGWVVKENVVYTLQKLKDWRDMGSGPKIGVISNFDERLQGVLTQLDLIKYFDIVLSSSACKEEKPSKGMFDTAIKNLKLNDAGACYHIGDSIESDIAGATLAGWNPIRFNQWFDNEFPDWTQVDSQEDAQDGAAARMKLMTWGRRDPRSNLQWIEFWSIDDILQLFGLPQDENMTFRTTYVRGFRDD